MITGIQLITGLIGSGKTLRAVTLMKQEVDSGRYVAAANFKGLNVPGVIEFDDPRKWQDLPPGSVLFVDEAQRFWRARRTMDIPQEVQAMETSRGEEGVSFVLITQQPTYLDKHIRGLVTRHEHLFRRMGLNAAELFRWERCHDEPMSSSSKDGADKEIFSYPKKSFSLYKSAEVHTVKRRLGTRMKLVFAGFAFVAGVIAWIAWSVSHDSAKPAAQAASASAGASPQAKTRTALRPVQSTEEFIAALTPRLEMAPWSAPVYDGRKAQAQPEVYCAFSGAGYDANGEWSGEHCGCRTEQGTIYSVSTEKCMAFAKGGRIYNPFKQPERDNGRGYRNQESDRERRSDSREETPRQPLAINSDDKLQTRYGQMRNEPIPADYSGSQIYSGSTQ